jgi:hypothetical protein
MGLVVGVGFENGCCGGASPDGGRGWGRGARLAPRPGGDGRHDLYQPIHGISSLKLA